MIPRLSSWACAWLTCFLFTLAHALLVDLSPRITSYAALGDSYASGDGAGSPRILPHFDIACGRFSDAYPVQIANSSDLDIEEPAFKNLACGGQSTLTVLRGQVPQIEDSQIVTLTVGGNEVDFFGILNECVHQWRPLSTCDTEWQKSMSLIESNEFIDNYGRLVKETVQTLKPGARLLVTGYAKFFNEETEYCDHVTFSRTDPSNLLTREVRTKLNDLINKLNDVIVAAVQTYGAQYIDMDKIFEHHRFCEEGVLEPDPDRDDTWFFNLRYTGDAGLIFDDKGTEKLTLQGLLDPIKDFFDLTRTFHPTSLGHKAIKEEILRQILNRRQLIS